MSISNIVKVPSPLCSKCNSYKVIITKSGIECDDCLRVVGFSVKKQNKKERPLKSLRSQSGDEEK